MSAKYSRRHFLRMSALAAAGAALAGCATPAPAQPTTGPGQPVATAKPSEPTKPGAEKVLRIITGSSGSSSFAFNCLVAGSDLQSWIPFMYVAPLYFDGDLKLKPGVFNSWESNDDKTTWTFKIDPRAKWSDGTPIKAIDFKVSWEAQCAPVNQVSRASGYLGNVEGFAKARENNEGGDISGLKVVDDATLQVQLVKPDPVFHWRIATCHLGPVKGEQYKKFGWDKYWLPENGPIFSGPFMLKAYDPDKRTAELVRNPNWWMGEGPYVDRVTFQFVTDQQTVGAMILNNQADLCLTPLPITMQQQLPDMFRTIKTFGYNVFWICPSVEPTDDLNVRKALFLSVDWEAVFKAAFPTGYAVKTNQFIDPDLPCLDKDASWYKMDIEAAKAALAASKYGSADKLPKLRVTPRGSAENNNRALEAVMGFWRQNLGISNVEFKQNPDEFGEDRQKINLTRDDCVVRFPDSVTYMWTGAYSTGPVAGDPEEAPLRGYKNEKIDAILDEAMLVSPDDPKRCEMALEAQKLFMEDYVVMPFGKENIPLNCREYVKDYVKGPDIGVIEPWKIKIEK